MAPRPTLATDGPLARDAERAVELLVEDLQAGWDHHDADITDRRLGDDVMWGSPFGASLRGYDRLHGIHEELKKKSVGGDATRFELVQWLTPAPGVAVAQVRRDALDERGRPITPTEDSDGAFSEMALYVLVERDDDWWVAAGQNTLISR
jgi:uncharacterized protein (TIGR02246 family)